MNEYKSTLSEEAMRFAADNLNEDETYRQGKIARIQRWLQTQTSLNGRTDANSVVRFLRCCKFDEDETKKRLTRFYQIRMSTPEWFENRDSDLPVLQELLDLGVFLPLRQRDSKGRMVIIIRAAVHDPYRHQLSDFLKLSNMMFDIAVEEDETLAVFGCVAVVDLSGVSLGHTLQLTPAFISKAVDFWENCTPVSIMRVDFLHAPVHINLVLDVFRRFMSDRFQALVNVTKDTSALHCIYSKDILPVEYGGTDGTIMDLVDTWKLRLKEKHDWLLADEQYKADKPPKTEDVFKYTALDDIW